MHVVRRHPRIAAGFAAVVLAVAVLAVAAARSRTTGCSVAPPAPDLPPALRVLGGLDRPFDPGDVRGLAQAAMTAAATLHPDLAAGTLGDPVDVAAAGPARYDALVYPLRTGAAAQAAPRTIVGLVAFRRGCDGALWYDDVRDVAASPPPAFPAVDRSIAADRLQVASPRLVYTASPFAPAWQDPATGRLVPAGAE